MQEHYPRRKFIKTAAIAGYGLMSLNLKNAYGFFETSIQSELYKISEQLLTDWLNALIKLQITSNPNDLNYGGIIDPAKIIIHGRIGDTVYPMLYMAKHTGDEKYLKSAKLFYQWMENNVSQEDGSWLNENVKNSWKGTTVFTSIALAESLNSFSEIIDADWQKKIKERLLKAGNFIYQNFSITYGNINYPINAAYALVLLGELLDQPQFIKKGKLFAKQALEAFTSNGFIAGEGALFNAKSAKGCYAIDLGYNVEESLPALVMYALLVKDEPLLKKLTILLQTHMEFMLPDGAWDNSWGTRNYKWTYWGSRTTDGCQTAYALMADRDPRFYKVALLNTKLLQKCTKQGLLYGGSHYTTAGIKPSMHHTFCHAKSLAKILDSKLDFQNQDQRKLILPREETNRIKFFKDIETCIISKDDFKATVTGYDQQYKNTKNGHASGGALTMLWHQKVGTIAVASMTEYQLFEADNMQTSNLPAMCLTPRIELCEGEDVFTNLSDLEAKIAVEDTDDGVIIMVKTKLLNKDQQNPSAGEVFCEFNYHINKDKVTINYQIDSNQYSNFQFIFPVVSNSAELFKKSDSDVVFFKGKNKLKITSSKAFILENRVFNFVPGFEAIPIIIKEKQASISIEIS